MYGDHHVLEVRRLLLALAGVVDVYASSAFQVIDVQFEETKIDWQQIEDTLAAAGYAGELEIPRETGTAAEPNNGHKPFFRHTMTFAQIGQTVGFGQTVPFTGPPLWPCPGLGPVSSLKIKELSDG